MSREQRNGSASRRGVRGIALAALLAAGMGCGLGSKESAGRTSVVRRALGASTLSASNPWALEVGIFSTNSSCYPAFAAQTGTGTGGTVHPVYYPSQAAAVADASAAFPGQIYLDHNEVDPNGVISGYAYGINNRSCDFVLTQNEVFTFSIFVDTALIGDNDTSTPSPNSQLGACSPGDCHRGDPISVATGNVHEEVTDYTTAGANSLQFTRYYNSIGNTVTSATALGSHWRSVYDRYLDFISSSSIIVERPDGKVLSFTLTSGVWSTRSDADYTLTHSGTTWTLTDGEDTVETYTSSGTGIGRVGSIQYRGGYTQTLTYNTSNQLTSVSDSYSRPLSFTYNTDGTLNTVSTADYTTITYGYASVMGVHQLTSVTFPTSPTQTIGYVYGYILQPFALTGVTDENGNTYESWTYDSFGHALTSQRGSGAALTTFVYGGGTTTVTNALGVTDTYTFTTLQGVPKVTGVSRASTGTTAAATEAMTYDSNGYLASLTDWNGDVTNYTNNSHGLPTSVTEAYGTGVARTTTIAYDSTFVHQPDTITTAGLTTTFSYDGSGNQLTKTLTDTTSTSTPYSTNGQARTWTYTYSSHLLASVQTPRTDVTAVTGFTYDGLATLRSITDALGNVTNVTLAQTGGLPQNIVDPNGVKRGYSWDARQRLVYDEVFTTAANYTTYYNRDAAGEITQMYPPDGTYRNYAYDTAHRLTEVSNRYNESVQYTLDALGGTTQAKTYDSTPTLMRSHSATFDALGRKLTDVGGASQTTTFTYDKNGKALTVEDGNSHTTTRTFDALGRLSTSTDANSGVVTTSYDAHNRPLTVQDQNGHTTTYVYNGFGDVIQQTSPDTGTTVYHYDNNGNLTQKVDAASVTVNQTFDKRDRLLTTTYPADTSLNVAYTYDQTGTGFSFGIGRLTSVTDKAGTLTRAYDERGNLLTEKRVNGGNTYTTSYAYNSSSRLLSTTYPDGTVVNNQYDYPGNVFGMTATPAGGSLITLASLINHFAFGPLEYIDYGNGMTETWFFDADYRPTSITANLGSIMTTAVMRQDYGYDGANNLTSVTDYIHSANSQTLTYDVLERLHTASSGTGGYGSYSYTLDPVGNLSSLTLGSTTTTYSYTSGTNRLSAIGSTSVSTNSNGNITSIPPALGGGASTFTYSAANRLASVSGGGSTSASYVYDAFGHRFSKTSGGVTTLYFYDQGGELLAEDAGGTYTDYAYVDGMPIAVFHPGASPTADQINYVSTDRLGTPQIISNNSQAGVWSDLYTPLGAGTPTVTVASSLRLPGQSYDAETGFDYNGARDYMPNLGRYLETDPIGLAGGINPYVYARNNPGSFIDPSGLLSMNLMPSQPLGIGPFTPSQSSLAQNQAAASQMYDPPGYSVAAHGGSFSVVDPFGNTLTAEDLAKKIKADPNYQPGEPVTLYSCSTGKGNNNIAQQLAKLLNSQVTAPNDLLWDHWIDNPFTGTPMLLQSPTIGSTPSSNTGHWRTFPEN